MMLTLGQDRLGSAQVELPRGATLASATTARLWAPAPDPAYVALAAARLSRRVAVVGSWGSVEADDPTWVVNLRVE